MSNEPTVFIVDDDEDVREAVGLLMMSVGLAYETYSSAQEFLDSFDPELPGCILLDVRMPGMSGLECQKQLSQMEIHPPIIIVTGHGDVPMAVKAVKSGALDFLEKPFNDQVLLDTVHNAINLDTENRGKAIELAEIKARLNSLTPRETEVLHMIVNGARNKIIAADLNISQSTVEAHRAKIMEKTGAKTLSGLMRMVLSVEDR